MNRCMLGLSGWGTRCRLSRRFSLLLPLIKCWSCQKVDGGAGILYIVKNYSGDVMNFEMATELATEGIRVLNILIDDVAVKDSLYTQGRRVWVPRCWQKNLWCGCRAGL